MILPSDKHEVTLKPVISRNGMLILEQGMDRQMVGVIRVRIPTLMEHLPATDVAVVKDKDGAPLDATDVVAPYLESLPGKMGTRDNLQHDRIRLLDLLPGAVNGLRNMQPLGADSR